MTVIKERIARSGSREFKDTIRKDFVGHSREHSWSQDEARRGVFSLVPSTLMAPLRTVLDHLGLAWEMVDAVQFDLVLLAKNMTLKVGNGDWETASSS